MITIDDFKKVDIRIGRIMEVNDLEGARIKAYKMKIDFGNEIGVKKCVAQIINYSKEELMNREVVGVVNLQPKQIANTISEVLILGVLLNGEVILLRPDKEVPLGKRIM